MTAEATTAISEDGLTFDPENHVYTFGGQIVPSVTQIIESVGLSDYSHIPWEIREMALRRGSAVHLATQFDDEGDLDEDNLNEEIRPYLEAWRSFRRDTGFIHEQIEHRGYNPTYRYAGTLDRRGKFGAHKVPWIIDIKTNELPEWVPYQLAAYGAMLPNPQANRRMCVALQKNKRYRVREFDMTAWQADFNVFAAAAVVHHAKEQMAA